MAKFGTTGREIIATFEAKATERGMVFDDDDRIVLEQAARVADIVAKLDAAIDADGAMLVGATGTTKTHPALTESRQQRLTLARLMVDIDRRLGIAAQGGSNGFRGLYGGSGEQNQQRDAQAAQRRGRGRMAR